MKKETDFCLLIDGKKFALDYDLAAWLLAVEARETHIAFGVIHPGGDPAFHVEKALRRYREQYEKAFGRVEKNQEA